MRKSMLKKTFAAVLCAVTLFSVLSLSVSADIGPKPSVNVSFPDLGDTLCYATLLSKTDSTGPESVWSGEEKDARHNENPNYEYLDYGYDIWKAFVDYDEKDPFFFLQCIWQVNGTKELNWTYYPPSEFKVLLYFPETGEYSVSEVFGRYAFDSYFTVRTEGTRFSVEYDEKLSSNDRINAYKSYNYGKELVSLAVRIVLTILIEILIGLLFGFRAKKQILTIAAVNAVTQIILNVLLSVLYINRASDVFVFLYFLCEVVVFVIEAAVYCRLLKKNGAKEKSNIYYALYSLAANAVSFAVGWLLASVIPVIF